MVLRRRTHECFSEDAAPSTARAVVDQLGDVPGYAETTDRALYGLGQGLTYEPTS